MKKKRKQSRNRNFSIELWIKLIGLVIEAIGVIFSILNFFFK